MAPQALALEEGQGKGATMVGLGKGFGGTEGFTFLSSCCDCSLAQLVSGETVEFSADDSVLKAQKYMSESCWTGDTNVMMQYHLYRSNIEHFNKENKAKVYSQFYVRGPGPQMSIPNAKQCIENHSQNDISNLLKEKKTNITTE